MADLMEDVGSLMSDLMADRRCQISDFKSDICDPRSYI